MDKSKGVKIDPFNGDMISRKALLDCFEKEYGASDYPFFHIDEIMDDIIRAPAVEAEPVRHGWWVLNKDGKLSCSECEGLAVEHPEEPETWQAITAFFPNCGAKMTEDGT